MTKYKNFIFDLDGTLIDSTPTHVKAFNRAIEHSSKKDTLEFNYEEMKGKRTIDVMLELGFKNDEAIKLTGIKQETYRELLNKGEVEIFPGVIDCFNFLRRNNLSCFICTGASRDSVEIILDKFNMRSFVKDYITGSDVKEAKPNPRILNDLISNNSLLKENCLFIEDSENGKKCGDSANVRTILVNNKSLLSDVSYNHFNDFNKALQEGKW